MGWLLAAVFGSWVFLVAFLAEWVVTGNADAVGVAPSGRGLVAGQVQFVFVHGRGAWPVVHGRALQGLAGGGFFRRGPPWRLLVPPGIEKPVDIVAQRRCDGGAFSPDQRPDNVA